MQKKALGRDYIQSCLFHKSFCTPSPVSVRFMNSTYLSDFLRAFCLGSSGCPLNAFELNKLLAIRMSLRNSLQLCSQPQQLLIRNRSTSLCFQVKKMPIKLYSFCHVKKIISGAFFFHRIGKVWPLFISGTLIIDVIQIDCKDLNGRHVKCHAHRQNIQQSALS